MNVSEFIVQSIINQGVEDVFLLPGGGCMYLVDAIARNKSIRPHPLLHEQSVGIAAESYAQYTNNLGFALVTTGPGGTNAITPCAAAWTDSTPMIFVSGQVKTADDARNKNLRQLGFQEVPITEIVSSITKKAIRVTSKDEVPLALLELLKTAQSGRKGPVWLDVPLDIQACEILDSPIPKIEIRKRANTPDGEILKGITEAIKYSKRPLFLLGNGVRLSDSISSAIDLIKLCDVPALLTWKMIDVLDENDMLNAGRPGAIAQRWSNLAQQVSDLIIVIGARLDNGQVAYQLENFAPAARKFIIDVDKAELSKFDHLNCKTLNFDAGEFILSLVKFIKNSNIVFSFTNWKEEIRSWKTRYPLVQSKHLSPDSGINLYEFIEVLSEKMTKDDVLAPGSSGACSEIVMQAFKVKKGQRVLNSEGLGPMGFGVPAPIGAYLASGRRTISIDGDGGFQMNIQELGTIALNKYPIKIFVLNNDGYGSIKVSQDRYFEGRRLGTDPSSSLGIPKISGIVQGYNLKYRFLEKREDLEHGIDEVLKSNEPEIIEIQVDPNQVTEPRSYSYINENGKLLTAPMEMLKPEIDEKELNVILNLRKDS